MSRRRAVMGLARLGLLGLVAPAQPAGAGPAPAPTLTVTPSMDLVDGQVVTVAGAGWVPGNTCHSLIIRLCPDDETKGERLDGVFEAEGDGTFSRQIHVRTVVTASDATTTD